MKHLASGWVDLLAALLMAGPCVLTSSFAAEAWTNRYLLDEQGRQLVPGGFVVIETVGYTPDDHRRHRASPSAGCGGAT